MAWRLYCERMLKFRLDRGLSQHDIALELDINKSGYRDLENGKICQPKDTTIEKIARVLGVELHDLVLEHDQYPSQELVDLYARTKAPKAVRALRKERPKPKFMHGVFAIDVDGVLLQQLDFSWKLVWKHCRYDDAERTKLLRRFTNDEISYQDWVNLCVDHFKARGLKRTDFAQITHPVTVIRNLRIGLSRLRDLGFIPVIISGGIDCFLEQRIPDYLELFDKVFINRLIFKGKGNLLRGESTPYDFAGKAECLTMLCNQFEVDADACVYVGDSFNDVSLSKHVGLTIACNPNTIELEQVFDQVVHTDDILDIVERVEAWQNLKFVTS